LSGTVPNANFGGIYTGAVTLNNSSNSSSGSAAGLTNVNAATVNGLRATNFWQTSGNSDSTPGVNFLGTSDNEPMELWVNAARAVRLEPTADSPNVIGGAKMNWVAPGVKGATIAGGGTITTYGLSISGPGEFLRVNRRRWLW
jgi:hypothetical protein